jgi:3D (Asp-Asp-Asp) domain-containing protein/septal ring factor EnvC (AmiA/AmiB activator)
LAAGLTAAVALLVAAGARADDPGSLTEQAARLRSSASSLASQEQQALLQLYALDSRLGRADRRLAGLERRAEVLESRERAARSRLALARSDLAQAEQQLEARLRSLYIEGDVNPLAILLGAESLDAAVSALDGLDRLATQDREILAQLTEKRAQLRSALRKLAARRAAVAALVGEAQAARDALAAARNERAAYIDDLRRQQTLNERQIAGLIEEAAAAEAKSQEIAASAPSSPSPPPPPAPVPEGGSLTVSSTGYCLSGSTSTGVPTGWGTVAVDPSVIPLGTPMYVPGYGEGVAADTGSAVRGAMIDLWFPSCEEARGWGRRTVTITLH